jgi:alanine-glyoxylate transaminase/(R)-3-amino-2-methylpropionate-pyruvate transaminase
MITDWSASEIIARRETWYAASQRAFMPYRTPLIFKRGSMQHLWDETGKRYIDLLGMNVCVSVGHAHPKVTAAVSEQLQQLQHCTTMFYHPVPAHFAEELAGRMPAGHDWVVHFTVSGAEAVDLALIMARSHTRNIEMLALCNGYHGATIGAQSLTGIGGFRHDGPLLAGVNHVANPDPYRGAYGGDTGACLAEMERTIRCATNGKLAGFIFEPIQGYGGIIETPPGYLSGAAEMVRARGGVLIADEVQSGFGRTGDHFWGFEAHGVTPEIVVMAKGIGNGFPLAAVVAQRHVAESLSAKFFFNTYGASPVSCAAGRAVLRAIAEEGLQENARTVGRGLRNILDRLHQKHEIVGDVRGRGLMQAIEIVEDRKSKRPATSITADIFERTREAGLVVSKSGENRNVLRMVPPLCLSASDLPEIEAALDHCFRGY